MNNVKWRRSERNKIFWHFPMINLRLHGLVYFKKKSNDKKENYRFEKIFIEYF